MILQALTEYYEELESHRKIAPMGWAPVKISWALEIDMDGHILSVISLRHPDDKGKRMIPGERELPAPVKRSSGVLSNFLWDNSSYILGVDQKGKPRRSEECFKAAQNLHMTILTSVSSPPANAVKAFFESWDPEQLNSQAVLSEYKDELLSGDNITFIYDGAYVSDDKQIKAAWNEYYNSIQEGETFPCLITGRMSVPELIHPAIKNVRGAQSSGAALVSFNAPAFESFGKKQNINAPVSKYAAAAYTSALNYLLSDKSHVKRIGDTTVVYWAKDTEEQYQDIFAALLDGDSESISNDELNSLMKAVASGKPYDYGGIPVNPDNDFYILGISPNAARLSIRFFYHRQFFEFIKNLKRYYEDIQIESDNRSKWDRIPLWALLRETVNQKSSDKTPLPQLAGDVMKAMIDGTRFPETLMNQTLIRIRAEHEITRGKAGIIKAYLIRNTETFPDKEQIMEVTTVSLNEESNYTPYVLGRLFSVLEGVQQAANPGINATIKDRFFNSACSTPGSIFPILLKLSNSHLRKMETGKSIFWSRQIGTLADKLKGDFPANLSLKEQGAFILGYYHQTQKRFEKRNNIEEAN